MLVFSLQYGFSQKIKYQIFAIFFIIFYFNIHIKFRIFKFKIFCCVILQTFFLITVFPSVWLLICLFPYVLSTLLLCNVCPCFTRNMNNGQLNISKILDDSDDIQPWVSENFMVLISVPEGTYVLRQLRLDELKNFLKKDLTLIIKTKDLKLYLWLQHFQHFFYITNLKPRHLI